VSMRGIAVAARMPITPQTKIRSMSANPPAADLFTPVLTGYRWAT
jgi:hypothetical protein